MRVYVPGLTKLVSTAMAVALMGLAGCATAPPPQPETAAASPQQTSASEQTLQQVRAAIDAGEFVNARTLLQQPGLRQLSDSQRIDWLLLGIELEQRSHRIEAAATLLRQLRPYRDQVSPQQDLRISIARANQYELEEAFYAAARERIFIASQLRGDDWLINHESIWNDLTRMPYTEISSLQQQNQGTELGRWLSLAELARRPDLSLDDQLRALQNWQQQNALHPAARQLPGNLAHLSEIAAQRPQRLAVALPLSGPLSASGNAIRDGLMASYYDALTKQQPVPDITFIDSQAMASLDDIYAEALLAGAQWMIGPVDKQQVQQLADQPTLTLPTLALNYTEDGFSANEEPDNASNLYQFGLAPEDEAIQIAERAWQNGHRRALVMVPQGAWGERIFETFRDHWQSLGGELSETRFYQQQDDYNPDIKELLNVEDSVQRYRLMRQLLRQSTEFEPRRREDADWLFLVAQPQQARQIKPMMAFNFAADIPVYSTSHVFSGYPDSNRDRDLDGIRFCDLPWVLNRGDLYQQIEAAEPGGQGAYLRLYALGVDAYRLIARLPQLQAFPNSRIGGVTGQLQLDPQRRIRRQTECAIFRAGQPRLLGSTQP